MNDHLSLAYPDRTEDELRGKTNWSVCGQCKKPCDLTTMPRVAWEGMSEDEKVEWLLEFIGWEKLPVWGGGNDWRSPEGDEFAIRPKWEPLSDWNHWRQVEGRMMENMDILNEYLRTLVNDVMGDDLSKASGIRCIVNADLPTRAKALYLALSDAR